MPPHGRATTDSRNSFLFAGIQQDSARPALLEAFLSSLDSNQSYSKEKPMWSELNDPRRHTFPEVAHVSASRRHGHLGIKLPQLEALLQAHAGEQTLGGDKSSRLANQNPDPIDASSRTGIDSRNPVCSHSSSGSVPWEVSMVKFIQQNACSSARPSPPSHQHHLHSNSSQVRQTADTFSSRPRRGVVGPKLVTTQPDVNRRRRRLHRRQSVDDARHRSSSMDTHIPDIGGRKVRSVDDVRQRGESVDAHISGGCGETSFPQTVTRRRSVDDTRPRGCSADAHIADVDTRRPSIDAMGQWSRGSEELVDQVRSSESTHRSHRRRRSVDDTRPRGCSVGAHIADVDTRRPSIDAMSQCRRGSEELVDQVRSSESTHRSHRQGSVPNTLPSDVPQPSSRSMNQNRTGTRRRRNSKPVNPPCEPPSVADGHNAPPPSSSPPHSDVPSAVHESKSSPDSNRGSLQTSSLDTDTSRLTTQSPLDTSERSDSGKGCQANSRPASQNRRSREQTLLGTRL